VESGGVRTELAPVHRHKQVKAHDGLRAMPFRNSGYVLLAPMHDADGKLQNLQLIYEDGRKRFLKGGLVTGCHHWIAGKPKDDVSTIYVAEGYSTGATIRQVMKGSVVVAFNTNNLRSVAEWLRQRYPESQIVLCADDDWKVAGNPGLAAATEAANAVDGLVAVPRFGEHRDEDATDFNDLMVAEGADAVKRAIDAATVPRSEAGADEEDDADKAAQKKQTDQLVELASSSGIDLYHSSDDATYVDINQDGHRETWAIQSKGFRSWLTGLYYRATKSALSPNVLTAGLAVLEARARFDGPQREVFLRVAGHDGRSYLDLCDKDWQVVEIDAADWRVIANAPVRFYRRKGMRALPVPTRGGSLTTLRKYLNVKNDDDFVLVVTWLLAALRDCGPYPVLDVTGEQGSAKSTLLTVLRRLVDPNTTPLRTPPNDERDLFIAAVNGFVLAYDNLSSLPNWLSDSFCRLSTGGGFATRMLYTDDEERLFNAARPILLGGIEDVVARGDLADRCVALQLAPIPSSKRRREREFWDAFDHDHSRILGALLDGMVHGLRELPNVHLDHLPRMADYAEWGAACEGAFWDAGTFKRAYAANRTNMTRDVVDADPVASAVHRWMLRKAAEREWSGTARELLVYLEEFVGEKETARKSWPGSANALGGRLRRAAPPLRRVGIEIEFGARTGKAGARIIKITRVEKVKVGKSLSALSALSAATPTPPSKSLNNKLITKADKADKADNDSPTSTSADNTGGGFYAHKPTPVPFGYHEDERERLRRGIRDAERAIAKRHRDDKD
jgi:Toprim domain